MPVCHCCEETFFRQELIFYIYVVRITKHLITIDDRIADGVGHLRITGVEDQRAVETFRDFPDHKLIVQVEVRISKLIS